MHGLSAQTRHSAWVWLRRGGHVTQDLWATVMGWSTELIYTGGSKQSP